MDLATFSQFQGYVFAVVGAFLVLYIAIPLVLSVFKDIPAEVLVYWHKARTIIFVLVLLACGYGAAKQYFANKVQNQDMPEGRQEVRDRVNAYERKVSK